MAALPAASFVLLCSAGILLASSSSSPATLPGSSATVVGGQSKQCALAGTWVNELGSTMTIAALDDAPGRFSGFYHTAVTASNERILRSPLQGVQQQVTQRTQPTFGFVVNWHFTDSTAVFVGQCFVDAAGDETLETTWLLREEVDSRAQDWRATRVGKNVFQRIK